MRTTAYHTADTLGPTLGRLALTILALVAACGCADRSAGNYTQPPYGSVSIARLKSLAAAQSTVITHDVAVTGYVVANDLYGEYYKSIVICDASGGVEIAVDSDRTATQFPVSARVTVHCSGLALGNYGGRIMLGASPTDRYTVDRIAAADFDRYFTVDTSAPAAPAPVRISIDELSTQHIGRVAELHGVTFADAAGLAWCDTDPETGEYIDTSRMLYDSSMHGVAVRTIARCIYRAEKIPTGYGSLRAVVEYFNGEYSLRIVNHGIEFPDGDRQ